MTLINVASSIIYTKGAPLREKIQTYGLALVFLVLLYNSPSGLVFYWVFNQIFSLCKNIVLKLKHPGRIVHASLSIIFVLISVYFLFFRPLTSPKKKIIVYAFTLIFVSAPLVISVCKKKNIFSKVDLSSILVSDKQNFLIFLTSCLSLSLLCGLLLPSNVIATSPSEFSFLGNTDSPLAYIWSSLAYFTGVFLFWPLLIYKMFSDNKAVKVVMPVLFFVLAMCALGNAFVFKYAYGTMSIFFKLDNASVLKNNSGFFYLMPIFFLLFIVLVYFFFAKFKAKKVLCVIVFSVCFAQIFIGCKNCISIKKSFVSFSKKRETNNLSASSVTTMYNLSKDEPNVFVIFLDRAIPCFFPYILEQFPDLQKSFDGFTFYPNTVSFADFTNCGVPAMCGGYDYTIDEINARKTELLKDKHNEALKVLPSVFTDSGFDSSVFGLPYEDYDSGKNIWDGTNVRKLEFPASLISDFYNKNADLFFENSDEAVYALIGRFSILQVLYPPLRAIFYHSGNYYTSDAFSQDNLFSNFVENFVKLSALPELTSLESDKPTFHFVGNDITHEYTELLDGYVPGIINDANPAAGTGNYKVLQHDNASTENDYLAYHVNAAAILQVGKWLDYLQKNDVYDNTRIIIVSDHGRGLKLPLFESFSDWYDVSFLNPLLLVKDFNSHGEYKTDMTLHTNADVPYFATKDLDVSKVNPFTGNEFKKSSDFDSFNVYRIVEWNIGGYRGKTQFPLKGKKAYTVHDNIFDEANWTRLDTSEVAK